MTKKNTKSILIRFWVHIDPKHRIQLVIIFIMMLVASVLEVVSIGSVIPFLSALTEPEKVFNYPQIQPLILAFGIQNQDSLIIVLTISFICAALLSGGIRVLLMWMQTRVSYLIGADLATKIFERTIYQPYLVHMSRNTSEVITASTSKIDRVISQVIYPFTIILSSSIILLMIMSLLMFIEPLVAIFTFFTFGIIYSILIVSSRKIIKKSSLEISQKHNQVVKILQEGLGGIRDILIDSTQKIYVSDYRKSESKLRKSIANIIILSGAPRYIVESLGITFIGLLAFWLLHKTENFLYTISILGVLALAAQRILPLAQQLFASWSSIRGSEDSLVDVLNLLEQKLPFEIQRHEELFLKEENPYEDFRLLDLKNISLIYPSSDNFSIRNLTLQIKRGEKVGIIGATGSGKSTLLDLIMSLLVPSEGCIEINGIKLTNENNQYWKKKLSHVPQQIYLCDGTIAHNIAFGVSQFEIDSDRVVLAAKKAGLSEFISTLRDEYQTIVGERGMRLSGGQRQRIGIARALYKKASIIILDEATSALDSNTEDMIMSEIASLGPDITLLIVAHRISTLKACDYIVEIKDGRINQVTNYKNLGEYTA